MGKRITQQARGRGGPAYRIRKKAFKYRISYPPLNASGAGKVTELINSSAHSAPLALIEFEDEKSSKKEKFRFIVPAADGIFQGQEISIGKRNNKNYQEGDILSLKDVSQGAKVFNIESYPGRGGKFARSSGTSGIIMTREKDKVEVLLKKRRLKFNEDCRVVIGVVSGYGRILKPLVKAGKRHHLMKSVGRKWHRTSAVKVNAVDHPFGSGRGKRIKSKIAQRNAPPGAKVGHIRPKKTGRRR